MKTFTVVYRGADGGKKEMALEAADRAEVFSILKERGISAISVRDGAPSGGPNINPYWNKVAKLCGFIVGVLIAGAISTWFSLNPIHKSVKSRTQTAAAETKTVKKKNLSPEKRKVEKTGNKLDDMLAEVDAAGERVRINAPKIKIPPGYTNRTFKTGVEQLMSWVFTVELGDMPMPIPPIGEDDRARLGEILSSTNEIKEGDSQLVAEAKEIVDYAKKEMASYIKAGGDPDDFLQYYFGQLKNAFELRNDAQQQLYELEDEDPEIAEQFAKRVNAKFAERGIKPIMTSKQEEEEAAE